MEFADRLCVTPQRKRTWVPASVTNAYSTKRRRISLASADLTREISAGPSSSSTRAPPSGDRFIAARPDFAVPLDTTPRSRRIANVLGLVDDRVLKFSGADPAASASRHEQTEHKELRSNFSQLLATPAKVSPTSCVANLGSRKQFILALDGPGVPPDPFAYPLTWSRRNLIAVACGKDVYYQDLNTRVISHLCAISKSQHGRPASIQWSSGKPNHIAIGTTLGAVQVWDAETRKVVEEWQDEGWDCVGGMDWREDLLAVGVDSGAINFYDQREPGPIPTAKLELHKTKVHGLKWSTDGQYLASSDQNGVVYIWDVRAGKELSANCRMGGRMKHHAPVKALAWCPWQPDLLATGSTYPDGKIRIFSVKSTAPIPVPQHMLTLNTAITSLQWSPHCKELLSTHGTSWNPNAPKSPSGRPIAIPTPYTNSITVHSYPSYRRLLSVPAHAGAVGHSCLSPCGTMLFTICPAEEAMKMWKVWDAPSTPVKRETSFGRFGIR